MYRSANPDHDSTSPASAGSAGAGGSMVAGQTPGVGRAIGWGFATARDALARGLLRLRVRPNHLTIAGLFLMLGVGYCLARGAGQQLPWSWIGRGPVGWWPLGAGGLMVLACACDMLDGAVARLGRLGTTSGGILDSTLDRLSDMAVFFGCVLYFGRRGNLAYQVLAVVALCNAFMISYVKARAEEVIDDCSVGFWLRGERCVGILVGLLTGSVPAMLWQQAVSPFFTVLRRVTYAYQASHALETGQPAPGRGPTPGWRGWLQPWRCRRGSLPHDLVCAFNIFSIPLAPHFWPVLLAIGPEAC
jgi:CDP-diacylglycerol--glycerol-3-phosphate 3-phosphatidyltransferase